MKIKSVLFLTPRRSDKYLGGVEKHVKILGEYLRRKGIEVGELSLSDMTRLPRVRGSRNDKPHAWKYLWKNRKLILGSDIIHVHDVFWWYSPFRLLFFWRPVFITFHGWEGVYPPSKSAIIQKKFASLLCSGSIGVGEYLEKWYGIKTNEITYGVFDSQNLLRTGKQNASLDPSTRQELLAQDDATSIVFLGRLEEVNGIDIFLKVLNISNRQPSSRMRHECANGKQKVVFIGDGSYRKKCEKYGEVTGMIKDVKKYLEKADIVIASSYLSIMEAMALRKPIVAIANNPLKRDYLECHPMRKRIKIAETAEELKSLMRSDLLVGDQTSQADCHGPPEAALAMTAMKWARKQTPEKLAKLYMKLWKK